jgi:divalent metal cation (Fe/Co/Zn/Cd) transporter
VRKMGFSFYVELHIMVHGVLRVRQGHKVAHERENKVLNGLPQIAEVLVHVEPQEELIVKSAVPDTFCNFGNDSAGRGIRNRRRFKIT